MVDEEETHMIKILFISVVIVVLIAALLISIFSWVYVEKVRRFIEGVDFKTATVSLDRFSDLTINVAKPLTEENIHKIVEKLNERPGFIVKFFFGDGSQLHLSKPEQGPRLQDPFLD